MKSLLKAFIITTTLSTQGVSSENKMNFQIEENLSVFNYSLYLTIENNQTEFPPSIGEYKKGDFNIKIKRIFDEAKAQINGIFPKGTHLNFKGGNIYIKYKYKF